MDLRDFATSHTGRAFFSNIQQLALATAQLADELKRYNDALVAPGGVVPTQPLQE